MNHPRKRQETRIMPETTTDLTIDGKGIFAR